MGPDGVGKRFGTYARSCLAMINSWLLASEILDHQISCCRPSKVALLAMACRTVSAVDQSWICTQCMAMLIGRSELVTSIELVSCVLHTWMFMGFSKYLDALYDLHKSAKYSYKCFKLYL